MAATTTTTTTRDPGTEGEVRAGGVRRPDEGTAILDHRIEKIRSPEDVHLQQQQQQPTTGKRRRAPPVDRRTPVFVIVVSAAGSPASDHSDAGGEGSGEDFAGVAVHPQRIQRRVPTDGHADLPLRVRTHQRPHLRGEVDRLFVRLSVSLHLPPGVDRAPGQRWSPQRLRLPSRLRRHGRRQLPLRPLHARPDPPRPPQQQPQRPPARSPHLCRRQQAGPPADLGGCRRRRRQRRRRQGLLRPRGSRSGGQDEGGRGERRSEAVEVRLRRVFDEAQLASDGAVQGTDPGDRSRPLRTPSSPAGVDAGPAGRLP